MFLREDREIDSGSTEEKDTTSPLEDNDEIEYLVDRKILVIRCTLNVQTKEEEEQHENIFQTRCYNNNKVCSIVINGKSCTNVANISLVEKLNLLTFKPIRLYKL